MEAIAIHEQTREWKSLKPHAMLRLSKLVHLRCMNYDSEGRTLDGLKGNARAWSEGL